MFHRAAAADWLGFASSGLWGISKAIWEQTADVILRTGVLLVPLAGFILGALGVGAEFDRGTIPFLLTRPRTRAHYLWQSWLVSAAEMTVLVAISILLFTTRIQFTSRPPAWSAEDFFRTVAAMLVPAGVIFCTTFSFTVFLRKEQHGTNAAVAAIFSYSGLFVIIKLLFNVRLPIFWELYASAFGRSALPTLSVVSWMGVALILLFASHFSFQRAEV